MDEVQFHAAKIGLPISQAEQFFCYYESKGWKVGKSPMKNWRMAMAGWKLRWEERRAALKPNGAELVIGHTEFRSVEAKMRDIRSSYSEHQNWTQHDIDEFQKLKARKIELKKLLGMQV
jgi:hypothetical protein